MAFKGKGRHVNREELAEIFGVSLNTITSWLRNGCPYEQKGRQGKPWRFNTRDVSEWREEQAQLKANGDGPMDETELKLRKLEAETIQAELDLAQARKLVATIEEMERAWSMQCAVTRANVLNVAGRVVTQLIGETDEARFMEVLQAEQIQALESAAEADIELEPEEEELDEL